MPRSFLHFLVKTAAAHFLSKLPTLNLILQCDCRTGSKPRHPLPHVLTPKNLNSSRLSTKAWLQLSNLRRHHVSKIHPLAATVSFSLSTTKPERVSSADKFPK